MNGQRTDVTYLIRRLVYAAVFLIAGVGVAYYLEYRLGYSKYAIFISISVIIGLGAAMNLYNYFTVFFKEENDALIITYGLKRKRAAIVYSAVTRCVLKENTVDKLFRTKTLSVFYPDYKGLLTEQALGLKAEYADRLAAYIYKRMSGEDGEFPVK